MYESLCVCVCVVTTVLPIDLEANQRATKHPSQSITPEPFRDLPVQLLCLSALFLFLCAAFHKYCIKVTRSSFP